MAAVTAIDITSLLLVEGSTPTTPAATKQRLFVRSSDHQLALVNSSGTVTPIIPAGAMSLIGSNVLGSNTASFSFTSIPGTYNHLRLVVVGRCSGSVFDGNVGLQFNADSSAIYDGFRGRDASATTLGATEAFAATSAYVGTVVGASGPANIPGISTIEIPLYAGTTFHKTGWFNAGEVGTSTGNDRLGSGVFNWRNMAAITRVDVILTTGTNFLTGSAAYLYGIV